MPSASGAGLIKPGIASTTRLLNRVEPTTLPIAISCSFLICNRCRRFGQTGANSNDR